MNMTLFKQKAFQFWKAFCDLLGLELTLLSPIREEYLLKYNLYVDDLWTLLW